MNHGQEKTFLEGLWYGVLISLWMLEELMSEGSYIPKLDNLKVEFLKPVLLDDLVKVTINSTIKDKLIVNAITQDKCVCRLTLSKSTDEVQKRQTIETAEAIKLDTPQRLSFNMIESARGSVYIDPEDINLVKEFANSCKFFGIGAIKEIVSLSTLVGMHCPGLHSMFSSFNITLRSSSLKRLYYKTIYANEKLGFAKIGVQGSHLIGQVASYFKQEFVIDTFSNLRFDSSALKGRKALIIGGSGLGLDAAKILKAQGSDDHNYS